MSPDGPAGPAGPTGPGHPGRAGPVDLAALERDYRVALLRFLPQQGEDARAAGYELGRAAIARGAGALDLVEVHHRVLAGLLAQRAAERGGGPPGTDLAAVVTAGGAFLLEVLASVEMSHPALRAPGPDAATPGA